jgi:hypothetical protein
MRAIPISMVTLAVIVGGCSAGTDTRVVGDPPIWGRADCQRGEGNPALQADFDKAKATCLARGESATVVAGTAGNSPCMNEQGYVLRTRAEHAAACQGRPRQ